MNSWVISDEIRRKYGNFLLLALILAGLAGNYFHFPLFFDIDFLFGSTFALLALQIFGLRRGTLAAALIASYTYFLWQNPYAIAILTAEVAVVGALMKRCRVGMVLADTLYWLVIGMPLSFVFYHWVIKMPPSISNIMLIQQAINGIANALLSILLFSVFALGFRSNPISFRVIVYNLLASFALFPALILLAFASRADFAATDGTIRSELADASRRFGHYLETWVADRKLVVQSLAEMAATQSPELMQSHLEQAQRSDKSLLRVGLMDAAGTVIAYYPPLDELGNNNIGANFPDNAFIADLKRTLKPMVSQVPVDRIGVSKPMVAVAPVIIGDQYVGYVTGILRLAQVAQQLDQSTASHAMFYTVLDREGHVVMTNRPGQKIMTPMVRGKGVLHPLDAGISQWMPELAPGGSIMDSWSNSLYVAQSRIGSLAEWQLILEQPVAPFQKILYDGYSRKLLELFLVLIGALMLAELLARRVLITIDILSGLTRNLPARLATDDQDINWPETAITEANDLIGNFREMSEMLRTQFDEVYQSNELLEERVYARTEALAASEEAYRTVADFTNEWEYWLSPDGTIRYMSPSCLRHTGYSANEFQQDPGLLAKIVFAEDREKLLDHIPGDQQTSAPPAHHQIDFRITTRDGEVRWFEHVCQPVYDDIGKYLGQRASNSHITERKQMQEQVRQLAFYDPLTKLPNRRLLDDRLSQTMAASKRSGNFCALMMLDLDNFKPLNDAHGHSMGDLLLSEVAIRLTNCVREIDTVARIGGDEFVVMLSELSADLEESRFQAAAVAEKIRNKLAESYLLTSQFEGQNAPQVEHHCTASIGVVLFHNGEASADAILNWADAAMYEAKASGRNAVWFHGARA